MPRPDFVQGHEPLSSGFFVWKRGMYIAIFMEKEKYFKMPIYSETLDSIAVLRGENELHIVVVNYNNLGYTRDVVSDLIANKGVFDLTIVDQNSSEGGTKEYLDELTNSWKSERRVLNIVRNDANTPLNWVWNWFAERAVNAKYLGYLNNDIRLPRNFVSDTIEVFHREPNCGIVVHSTNILTSKVSEELSYMKLRGNHMQGWDFTIRKDIYNPIDRKYELFYGDNWVFSHVYEMGYDVFGCYSSPILHYASKTIKKMPDYHRKYENEGKLWKSERNFISTFGFDESFSSRWIVDTNTETMRTIVVGVQNNRKLKSIIIRNYMNTNLLQRTLLHVDNEILISGANRLFGKALLEKIFVRDNMQAQYEYIVLVDEDCLMLDSNAIDDIIDMMEQTDVDMVGVADGNEIRIRNHRPDVPNIFFTVFKTKKLQNLNLSEINNFPIPQGYIGNTFRYDSFEPYYPYLCYFVYGRGCHFLSLKAETSKLDNFTTEVYYEDRLICVHTWYARQYAWGREHTKRINESMDHYSKLKDTQCKKI